MGRYDEALALYERRLERYPGDESLLYGRAFLFEQMDRVGDSIKELEALLAKNPDAPVALNALGYTLADRTTEYERARDYIARAYEQSPDSPAIIDSLGWVLFKRGKYEEALVELERRDEARRIIAEKNPDLADAERVAEKVGVGAIVLFGVLGTAVISLTFLPALSVMVLGLRPTRPASRSANATSR